MNTPLELDAFVALIEAGNITAAARRLGEPRATLSRRLGRLEDHLGVRLVHRSTRRFEPTRAGLELYSRGRRIVDEVRAAEQALRTLDGTPRGPLRISIPPGPASPVFGELLADFLTQYPGVVPDVFTSDRHVDLVREGFDLALRAGRDSDPALIRRVLLHDRLSLIGAPAYLAARGTPSTTADLAGHACIVGYGGGDRVHPVWPLRDGGELRVVPALACNGLEVSAALVLAGKGLAVLPELAVGELLADGRLVRVLPEAVGAEVSFSLVYPERRLLEPQVRAFLDFAVPWFAERPGRLRGRCPR